MPRMSQSDYLAFLARSRARTGSGAGEGVERESELHQQILDTCNRLSLIALHSRMDRPTTTQIGAPDFVILCDNGKVLIVEAKNKTGKVSIAQAALHAWAAKLGHNVHIVRSIDEFLRLL